MHKPPYNPDTFYDWMEIPVRFRDLDPLNHVNNAIFSTYYEEARIHLIQRVPAFYSDMQNNRSFVLVNIHINFISQVEYPATLLVGSGILKKGNSSITSFQAIYTKNEERLVSTAEATGVWYDLTEQRPVRLPEIEALEAMTLSFTS